MQDPAERVAVWQRIGASLLALVATGGTLWFILGQGFEGDALSEQAVPDVHRSEGPEAGAGTSGRSALELLYAGLGASFAYPPVTDDQQEIPAEHPLALLLNASVPVARRVPADLEARLPTLDEPSFRPVVLSTIGDVREESVIRHELLSLLRRSGEPELDAILVGLLLDPAESALLRSYAAQHLAINLEQAYQPETVDRRAILARALASDPEIMVRREALLGLARADDAATLALIRAADGPGVAGMEDLVLTVWHEQDWRELAPRVVGYLDHHDESTVVAAVALIATWRIDAGRHHLASHFLDGRRSPRVDRAVGLALRRFEDVRGSPQNAWSIQR